ncbi:TPA: hypothetical protein N0F65_006331 [Lagenidium giganteum]|uniref:Uncharacterized protein n=1 Tax=Lagenidium giganteum TaxID=4803 RepID=A0AAV2YR89_9STRA|nr:TPA: hypothetical protein N0F65_006331 [Lagenidium giganteum]
MHTILMFFNVLSYVMASSDAFRSGLGQSELSRSIEPNSYQYYGPWFYSVNESLRNPPVNTSYGPPVWMYKYDTTSVVWRSFARFFELPSYPECFLYKSDCENNINFSSKVWFQFVDEMADAAASVVKKQPSSPSVVLRTQSRYLDRIHHWLFPYYFVNPVWRTNQIMHFLVHSLFSRRNGTLPAKSEQHWELRHHSVCNPKSQERPLFCDDVWINFRRTCNQNDTTTISCQKVGIVWLDIMRQVMNVQLRFPNLDVDLTLLSSAEDVQVCKGGLAFIGRRKADVSSVIRVRNCTDGQRGNSCNTVFAKDHRYQVALFTTNANEYYPIVSILRAIGQSYFYLRVGMLFGSCYVTRAAEERYTKASLWRKLRAAMRLFSRIPSQCIVYGSPIPICCYALAHFIDAPMTYEMVAQAFTTPMGNYKFEARKFAFLAANQMRNVWFLAIILHFLHWVLVHRRQWSAPRGILGVPEFMLGILSCLSICLQLRLLSLRDSRILSSQRVNEHVDTSAHKFSMGNGFDGNMLLEGVVLDGKFFMCLLAILGVLLAIAHTYEGHQSRTSGQQRHNIIMSRMAVPYTAGVWWSTLAFSVSWGGTLFPMPKAYKLILSVLRRPRRRMASFAGMKTSRKLGSVSPLISDIQQAKWPHHPVARAIFFQQEMEHIHTRTRDIDSLVALLNLVAMSDPLTFIRLKLWRGHAVHYFKDAVSGRIFAIPAAVETGSQANANIPWEQLTLIYSCNTQNMRWSDIIHVG